MSIYSAPDSQEASKFVPSRDGLINPTTAFRGLSIFLNGIERVGKAIARRSFICHLGRFGWVHSVVRITRKYEQATNWLVEAGVAYHCFNISGLALPLSFSQKRNLYKLYMLDTGLLCAMSMNGIQNSLLSGDIKINEGMVAENYVAAALAKKKIPLHYYDKKTRTELDFVWNDGASLSVIEVKSGNEYRRHIALDNAIFDNPGVFQEKNRFAQGQR